MMGKDMFLIVEPKNTDMFLFSIVEPKRMASELKQTFTLFKHTVYMYICCTHLSAMRQTQNGKKKKYIFLQDLALSCQP